MKIRSLAFIFIFLCVVIAKADWASNFAGIGGSTAQVTAYTTDSAGNSYFVGTTTDSTLTFGGVTLNKIGPVGKKFWWRKCISLCEWGCR
jgi:hypothetical protein